MVAAWRSPSGLVDLGRAGLSLGLSAGRRLPISVGVVFRRRKRGHAWKSRDSRDPGDLHRKVSTRTLPFPFRKDRCPIFPLGLGQTGAGFQGGA